MQPIGFDDGRRAEHYAGWPRFTSLETPEVRLHMGQMAEMMLAAKLDQVRSFVVRWVEAYDKLMHALMESPLFQALSGLSPYGTINGNPCWLTEWVTARNQLTDAWHEWQDHDHRVEHKQWYPRHCTASARLRRICIGKRTYFAPGWRRGR